MLISLNAHATKLTKYERLERRLSHIEALLTQQLSDAKAKQDAIDAHNKAGDACLTKYGPWSENEPKGLSDARRECFEAVPTLNFNPRFEY